MLNPTRTYTGGGVEPVYGRERALNLPVTLPGGVTIPKGSAIGFVPGTGTAVNDSQTITPGGTVSGGTFRILFAGQLTSALAYNATAAQVKAALALLSTIGSASNLTVTGGGLDAAPLVITFIGELAGLEQPTLVTLNSLTGSSPTCAVTHTTYGKPANGYYAEYDEDGIDDGREKAKGILQYDCTTDTKGNITLGDVAGAADNGVTERSCPAWFQGEFRCSDIPNLDANAVTDLGKIIRGDATALTATTTILRIT